MSKIENNNLKNADDDENAKFLNRECSFDDELNIFVKEMELTEDTTCGFWKFKGGLLQMMANKKVFILVYGLCGLMFAATFAYFNGTISTMEKRFKVTSRTMGVVLVGNDITQLFVSIFLSYYAGKGHRPRWLAFGMYCVTIFCFLCAIPHFIYGSGEDALSLTVEYGRQTQLQEQNQTVDHRNNLLCSYNSVPEYDKCEESVQEGNMIPITIWFVAQLISGIGGALYYALGYAYIDDNIKKSKSPGVISLTYFIRTIGPTIGYALVSIFLKLYIAPDLTPTIDNKDPRWIGAWWMGWLIMGSIIAFLSTILLAFPRELPRAAARRELVRQKSMEPKTEPEKPSIKDLCNTIKRLMKNSIYIFNQLSAIFFCFGYIPFWVFLPKYIETQYRQSASASSLVTGTVGLIFSALGILVAGIIIQKFKPSAKNLSFWNVCITVITLVGLYEYSVLGCPGIDNDMAKIADDRLIANYSCNVGCNCEFVKFSPVCSVSSHHTYISPCHAGCTTGFRDSDEIMNYGNCSCVSLNVDYISDSINGSDGIINTSDDETFGGSVVSGQCQMDCQFYFYTFLATVCILKFAISMGRTTTFLLSVRCVEERDKTLSLGIGLAVLSVFALIPSPVFFGYIMDTTCIVWGKVCGKQGNCWLYDATLMRERVNYIAIFFMVLGLFFDVLIWWRVPNIDLYGEVDEQIMKGAKTVDKNNDDKNSKLQK